MTRVLVEVPIYPTENVEKVRRALSNIVFGMSFIERTENGVTYLTATSEGVGALAQLQRRLREQATSSFARKVLSKSAVQDSKIRFLLNKQAAFMGVVHFCEKRSESPLGPITIEVESDSISSVINYITGQTE